MTTQNRKRVQAGVTTGGQFAEEAKSEPGIALQPAETQLTARDLAWAKKMHGTYDADSSLDYYPTMAKVFAAAEAYVASTPEGQREAARVKRLDDLSAETGIVTGDLADFGQLMERNEPGSAGWEEMIEIYGDDIWRRPREQMVMIDAKLREPLEAPAERALQLLKDRRRIDNELGAMHANEAAARILNFWPTAAKIMAYKTDYGDELELHVAIRDAKGHTLWEGDPDETGARIPYGLFDDVDLVPDDYGRGQSPLRTCTTEDDSQHTRFYDVAKMAALKAEDLV